MSVQWIGESVKHLIPTTEEEQKANPNPYRTAAPGEEGLYDPDHALYRTTVKCELEDPLAAALFFREVRNVTNRCDIDDVRVELTVELSGMTEYAVEALKQLVAASWSDVVAHTRPECVYYREPRKGAGRP